MSHFCCQWKELCPIVGVSESNSAIVGSVAGKMPQGPDKGKHRATSSPGPRVGDHCST